MADILGDEATRAGARTSRAGGCLCGAVRFVARDVQTEFGVCHCQMCQRWGGPFMAAGAAAVDWEGAEHIRAFASSDWAERGFCERCGSHLFYRVTAEGPHQGAYELPVGLFDDLTGLRLAQEIYVDAQPDAYAFAPGLRRLTEAQWLEKLGVTAKGEGGA